MVGKVKVEVDGKSKISYKIGRLAVKYDKWQEHMVSGRKNY